NHAAAPIDQDHVAELVGRSFLGNDFGRNFGRGSEVMAKKTRIGDLDKRIIYLKIKDLPNAPFPQPIKKTAIRQCSQCAPMAVRIREQSAWSIQQQPAGIHVESRHGSLTKEMHLLVGQAEVVVFLKERFRLSIGCRARHNQERYRLAIASSQGQHLFGMDLEESLLADGANRKHSLRRLKTESTPLPSGDQQHSHVATAQGVNALLLDFLIPGI